MPIVDMPLAELETYQGLNPRPADFDAYWDTAIAEQQATDPEPELRPAELAVTHVRCSHLFFTGVGGARIHAKLAQPIAGDTPGPGPALLRFHGYSGDSGDWLTLLAYAGAGFTIAGMDCRGQGGLSEDTGATLRHTHTGHIVRGLADGADKLLYRAIFLDTVQLARVVATLDGVDAKRMGALGASQGGGLTLACAALTPNLKRAAPTFPFLCDYRRVWEMDLAQRAYLELAKYLRMADPTHQHADATFERLGYIDVQHLAPRIEAEILMGVGLMDEVCPPSTQFAAYNKITAPKRMEIYPDFEHETPPGFDDSVLEFMLGV